MMAAGGCESVTGRMVSGPRELFARHWGRVRHTRTWLLAMLSSR